MRIANLLIASAAAFAVSASAASAADVIWDEPAAPAPIITATPYSWTGFYVGLAGGAATGDFDFRGEAVSTFDPTLSETIGLDVSGGGLFGGAQVGYDFQYNNFVFGAVADIFATNIEADVSASLFGDSISAESELKYLGTVRGRLGYAADRFLVYAHGGFAYGETEQTISFDGDSFETDSGSKTGWVAGAGVEYAVTDQISVQTEYSYYDLGRDTIYSEAGAFGGAADVSVTEDLSFHTVKAAVNFRF